MIDWMLRFLMMFVLIQKVIFLIFYFQYDALIKLKKVIFILVSHQRNSVEWQSSLKSFHESLLIKNPHYFEISEFH